MAGPTEQVATIPGTSLLLRLLQWTGIGGNTVQVEPGVIQDGSNPANFATVKAASTPPALTDTTLVVADPNLGGQADAAASSDTATASLLALLKRLLQKTGNMIDIEGMIPLSATDTISALAGTGAVINFSVSGQTLNGTTQTLYAATPNGTLGTGATSIWAATAGSSAVRINLQNSSNAQVAGIQFTISGAPYRGQFAIPALGSAVFDGYGIHIADQFGNAPQ